VVRTIIWISRLNRHKKGGMLCQLPLKPPQATLIPPPQQSPTGLLALPVPPTPPTAAGATSGLSRLFSPITPYQVDDLTRPMVSPVG